MRVPQGQVPWRSSEPAGLCTLEHRAAGAPDRVRDPCVAAVFALPQSVAAQDSGRFPVLRADQLSPAQKKWADSIARSPRNANFASFSSDHSAPQPNVQKSLRETLNLSLNVVRPRVLEG